MSIANSSRDEYIDHNFVRIEEKLRYGSKLNYILPLIFSTLALGIIIAGITINLLGLKKHTNNTKSVNTIIARLSATPIVTPTPTPPLPLPKAKTGYKQIVINDLRFGYSYSDSHAALVEQAWPVLFRAAALTKDEVKNDNLKESVLKSDLLCSAGGTTGNVLCKNTKVEDYVNSLGFRGVKVYRTRYYEQNGVKQTDTNDFAYVFPLLHERIVGQETYTAVVLDLSPSVPDRSSISVLNELADTFFTY